MSPEDTKLIGNAHNAFHPRQAGDFRFVQGGCIADKIKLGEDLLGAMFLVLTYIYIG